MCRVLEVNRSYYYDSIKREGQETSKQQQALEKRVTELFEAHRQTYGSRRLTKALVSEGFQVGRYRIRNLMKKLGLIVRYPKRFRATTDSQHNYRIADNLLDRQFEVDVPNQVWTTDITYLWTNEGWLYLAIVVDLYSRQIIGWSIQNHMRTQLCIDALAMAWWRRKRPQGLLHHSDRGSQYASHEYQARLKAFAMKPSMSRKGNCWDNSPTERIFRTLKSEWLSRFNFQSQQSAKQAVWDYMSYYNSQRAHSALGYLSPMEYEQEMAKRKTA